MARKFLDRLPLWSFFPLGFIVLFAGLVVIGLVMGPSEEGLRNAARLREAELWVLVVYPLAEALYWTVAFTEAGARIFRAPLAGAMLGVFAYVVLYHGPYGTAAIVSSTWLGLVLACVYLAMRERSLWAAILSVICIRWGLIAIPFVLAGAAGP